MKSVYDVIQFFMQGLYGRFATLDALVNLFSNISKINITLLIY